MLDLDADRLREGHRVHEVPPVRRHPRAQPLPFRDGRARVLALGHVEAPGVVEVVLGAGALDRRDLFAVDVEHVVALAEPARLRLHDREHRPDVEPAALRVEKDPRLPVGRRRQGLAVARVEVRGVGRKARHLLPVHVVVHAEAACSLVGQRDAAGLFERHRPVAVARAAVGEVADHERADRALEAVADGEKVAERHVHARDRAAVVVDAQAQEARPAVLRPGGRRPDVRHDPRAGKVGDRQRLARQAGVCCRRSSPAAASSTRTGAP